MTRRQRRRTAPKRGTISSRDRVGFVFIALTLVALVAFGVIYFKAQREHALVDPTTLCIDGRVDSVVAVLIDQSDLLTPRQRFFIRSRLSEVKNQIPRNGKIALFEISTESTALLEPEFVMCNPGRGAEIDSLYESPRRAETLWEEAFSKPLEKALDAAVSPTEMDCSPIYEAIQSISLTALMSSSHSSSKRQLIVVSDLLQHTPEHSHYAQRVDFAKLKNTAYFAKVKTALRGVDVRVLYVTRPKALEYQGEHHVQFWTDYFLDLGAETLQFIRVEG